MPTAFAVRLPKQYADVMRAFEWLSFEWLSLRGPPECYGGFANRLAAAAISPRPRPAAWSKGSIHSNPR